MVEIGSIALVGVDADHFGVKNGDRMSLAIAGPCSTVFRDLLVRADAASKLEVHIDTDEATPPTSTMPPAWS